MAYQNETYVMGGTQITLSALGASVFPTTISPPTGCVGMDLQYISGGTAMVCPANISTKTISGATVPANIPGFYLSATPLSITGPAAFYMACGSSTASVIGINFRFSAGGATLV